MCKGETCVETFKLTQNELYEDTIDDYNHLAFNFKQRDNLSKVLHLLDQVPKQNLLKQPKRIGCPDCADGGGLYIQFKHDGIKRSWVIDNNLDHVPKSLHNFVKSVQYSIHDLKRVDDTNKTIVMCPAIYQPICVTEVVNGKEIQNTYSNNCVYANYKKGTFFISQVEGTCKK